MELVMRQHPNDWISESIMCKRGVGVGGTGTTHSLTIEDQGTFQYTIGPYSDPVLHIKPGDRVVVETHDAASRSPPRWGRAL